MSAGTVRPLQLDGSAIQERLRLTGLSAPGVADLIEVLQRRVISPNVDEIVHDFYHELGEHRDFTSIVTSDDQLARLMASQRHYLLRFGDGIDTPRYFEDRIRIGAVHYAAGVSLSLYQCFFSLLQLLIIENFPDDIRASPEMFEDLVMLVIRLTSLDMSLATEAYHATTVRRLEATVDEFRQEGETLRQHLRLDSLTGVYTRDHAIQSLKMEVANALAQGSPLCVVMADVDHFKDINDEFGHLVGDHVLEIVARRIAGEARASDIVGRYGGEEFMLVFQGTAIDVGLVVAERIRSQVASAPVKKNSSIVPVSVSLGVAALSHDDSAETLTARADRCLYAAKRAGRNRVCSERDL